MFPPVHDEAVFAALRPLESPVYLDTALFSEKGTVLARVCPEFMKGHADCLRGGC